MTKDGFLITATFSSGLSPSPEPCPCSCFLVLSINHMSDAPSVNCNVDLIRHDDIWTSLVSESHFDDQPAHPNRPQTLQQVSAMTGLAFRRIGFPVFNAPCRGHDPASASLCIVQNPSNGAHAVITTFCTAHGVHHRLFLQEEFYLHVRIHQTHIIPLPTCSLRSCHTVFPEQLHTVLSLSQTPALRAITPTRVLGSSA